jgi:hypothetical protein
MDIRIIFLLMLKDKFGEEEIDKLALEASEQIKFSLQFLYEDLVEMGFSEEHAQLTARQIAPKPILYSFIIRNRILDNPELVPFFPDTKNGRIKEIAYRRLQYQLLAPEFTAFLFDQIIDEYNPENECTSVKKMIDQAREKISRHPDFYFKKIQRLWDICNKKNLDVSTAVKDDNLTALKLLVPLIQNHQKAGATRQEIEDLLYTVSDVLTHEQIASNAFDKGKFSKNSFVRPIDYLDYIQGNHDKVEDNSIETVARGILRNQGLLMVTISQYMIIRSPFYYNRSAEAYGLLRKPGITPVRNILGKNPQLIKLIRFFELIVRTGDDVGDLELDTQTQTPNCVILGFAGLDILLKASGIESEEDKSDIDPDGVLKKNFIEFFHRVVNGGSSNAKLLRELKELKFLGMKQIGVKTDHTNIDDSHLLGRILNEVAYGAIFNAIFNDSAAEEMGNALMQESSS